jgi:hypothetical protein
MQAADIAGMRLEQPWPSVGTTERLDEIIARCGAAFSLVLIVTAVVWLLA